MRVMLSAAGSAVAPGIIRHLQSLGHYVIGHDSCEYGYGASICDEFHKSPDINDQYVRFVQFIGGISGDVYLPFLDEEIRLFAAIGSTAKVVQSPCASIFVSKILQQEALQSALLPVAPIAIRGDCIAKPDQGRGGRGTFRAPSADMVAALSFYNYVVQRYIHGDEYTVDVLTDREGEFLFAVPRLRIQANGVSVIGQIKMDEEIIDLAKQVVSKFKFAGPINIQMIRERDTGKLYIIELNPRLSGSCMFTVMAGFDILDATIKLWEGKPVVSFPTIEDGLIIRRHYVEERL